jgi:hypothetical protein
LHAQLVSPRNRNNVSKVVLNAGMQRHSVIESLVAAALVVSAALPGIASAKLTELGSLAATARESCPLHC